MRITKREQARKEKEKRIFEAIDSDIGSTLKSLSKELGVTRQTIKYYLLILEVKKKVKILEIGNTFLVKRLDTKEAENGKNEIKETIESLK